MRFVKLDVQAFQGIERAQVEFGPGLNVLYGPNDLGKSTLASAVRAALLMLPKSTDARDFSPWFADALPRVTLTFVDDAERIWQIKKAFDSGSGASAELLYSKDGRSFSVDARAREVDEKVRNLLGWGIPAPGGKGAPRGLPESFLANALLAAQTNVDKILGASLEKDLDDSGKLRLQKALATLAQDPLFKTVIDIAQRECDAFFTAAGKLRRGQGTRLVEAGNAVREHEEELERLRRELDRSRDTEQRVRALHEARMEAEQAVADAENALKAANTGLSNAKARQQAELSLRAAEQALASIDVQALRVQELGRERDVLSGRVAVLETERAQVQGECEKCELAVRDCEEAVRVASSEAGEQARKVRTAELTAELAQLESRRAQLNARRDLAERAQVAQVAAQKAKGELREAAARRASCEEQVSTARRRSEGLAREVEQWRALLAYGRWRAAQAAAAEAEAAQRRAIECSGQATAKASDAHELREQTDAREKELADRRASLPSPEELRALEKLDREVAVARAALGGGLTVSVRSRSGVELRARVDGEEQTFASPSTDEQVIEAQRTAHLWISDLVELEVVAGSRAKRQVFEEARTRWQREGEPVLTKAGLSSLADLQSACSAVRDQENAVRDLRGRVAALEAEAQQLAERADILKQQAGRQVDDAEELAAKRAAIAPTDEATCEAQWTSLGKAWESRGESALRTKEAECSAAREQLAQASQDLEIAIHRLGDSERKALDLTHHAESQRSTLGVEDAAALIAELARDLEETSTRDDALARALHALTEEASAARSDAERALEAASARHGEARAKVAALESTLEQARELRNQKQGEWTAQSEQLEDLNRPAALALVEERKHALEALPTSPLATEDQVRAAHAQLAGAQRLLAERTEELHKAEGALSQVGGAQLAERVQQVEEGLEAARARERELEVDANAWKLLRDTLREAENEEGAHLGRALSGPVGERFAELTRGRYGDLRFDPLMRAEGLRASGAADDSEVLEALSVGTRDQLATLVRMTIATQLKSAIILDDHLVHTDPDRLAWFRQALTKTAVETQVLVFTCRPEDYLERGELADGGPVRDIAGGAVRAIDLSQLIHRWAPSIRAVDGVA